MNKVQKFVLIGFTSAITSIILLTTGSYAFAMEFANYTSEKYKIQFEYPTDWTVTEKTSRFDSGADISIDSQKEGEAIKIIYGEENLEQNFGSSDLETATFKTLDDLTTHYSYEFNTIENPSYITIDNQKTGTFLFTMQNKYEEYSPKMATQQWVTFIGDNGYMFGYITPTSTFDNPEHMEIRDNFIKSIKFLDAESGTNTLKSTSRFD